MGSPKSGKGQLRGQCRLHILRRALKSLNAAAPVPTCGPLDQLARSQVQDLLHPAHGSSCPHLLAVDESRDGVGPRQALQQAPAGWNPTRPAAQMGRQRATPAWRPGAWALAAPRGRLDFAPCLESVAPLSPGKIFEHHKSYVCVLQAELCPQMGMLESDSCYL